MIKLIAMDMDGTLTQHKSPLEQPNRDALNRLGEKYQLVIVGAGSCERILTQLPFVHADIIGNYGMQMSFFDEKTCAHWMVSSEKCAVDRDSVTERMQQLRERHGYLDYTGESVEFHECGMVTLPLLGTAAALGDKLAFDPDRSKRRAFYDEVVGLFPEYTVFVGGTSSFDMAPAPYNKLYALLRYAGQKGFAQEEILYFGDDYGLGGNDSQVYNSDIMFRAVDNYLDFPALCADL